MDAAEAQTQALLARIRELEAAQGHRPTVAPIKPSPVNLQRAFIPRAQRGKATEEELTSWISGLNSIIVSGVEQAGYGDKRTQFRSLVELRQIKADLLEELQDLLGLGGRIRQIRMTTQWDKGL